MDFETRNELRRKKLCLTCREPWTPDHICLGKGKIHYIEVLSKEEEDKQQEGSDVDGSHEEENEEQPPRERKKKCTQG